MKRLAAMHDWPLLSVRALMPTVTASSRLALGMTMNGSLPPSSSTTFLILFPAPDPTWIPAPSLPVRVAATTRGSSSTRPLCRSRSAGSGKRLQETRLSAEFLQSLSAHCGTLEACFKMPTLPAISPGAMKRNTCQKG